VQQAISEADLGRLAPVPWAGRQSEAPLEPDLRGPPPAGLDALPPTCSRWLCSARTPRVSVVMPVYNAARYLVQALESILAQTVADFELIVIDDGSRDGSLDLLAACAQRDRRIRLCCGPHRGVTRVLNAGIALARGEFIARMDADDIARPDRFAQQIDYLDAHPEVVAVGSYLEVIDPDGAPLGLLRWATEHEEIDRQLLNGRGGLAHPAAMMRRRAVAEAGGYRERFAVGQDKDLWLRLAERGRLANLPLPLVQYREHPAATSATRRAEQQANVRQAVADACHRRGLRPPRKLASSAQTERRPAATRRRWVRAAVRSGHPATAWKHSRQLLRECPWSKDAWLALLALAVLAISPSSLAHLCGALGQRLPGDGRRKVIRR